MKSLYLITSLTAVDKPRMSIEITLVDEHRLPGIMATGPTVENPHRWERETLTISTKKLATAYLRFSRRARPGSRHDIETIPFDSSRTVEDAVARKRIADFVA